MPEALRDDVAFVFHNGKSYTMTEVAIPTVDAMIANIRDVERRRVDALTSTLHQEFVREAFTLENREMDDIVRIATQNQVAIPQDKQCYPLVALNNRLCPVRSVIYSPNYMSGSLSGWVQWIGTQNTDFWNKMNELVGHQIISDEMRRTGLTLGSHKLVVMGSCLQNAVTHYTILNDAVYCTRKGFHTVGRSYQTADSSIEWHTCCTGDTPPAQYWNLPLVDFVKAINSLNLDSMANGGVSFGSNSTRDVVSLQNLILHSMKDLRVTHIPPNTGWEASNA